MCAAPAAAAGAGAGGDGCCGVAMAIEVGRLGRRLVRVSGGWLRAAWRVLSGCGAALSAWCVIQISETGEAERACAFKNRGEDRVAEEVYNVESASRLVPSV